MTTATSARWKVLSGLNVITIDIQVLAIAPVRALKGYIHGCLLTFMRQ